MWRWVHFSIDDVIESFRWIYANRPGSIFEEPMLAKIKEWHETFCLNCDLYIFEEAGDFSLKLLQDCYWNELKENRWLRLAWHRRRPCECGEELNVELQSLENTYDLITQKAGKSAWADSVRLHYYKADEELVNKMQDLGVYTFLTNAAGRGYDLSEEESGKLCQKGFWQKARHEYVTTDIRLDVIKEGTEIEELIYLGKETISKQTQKLVLEVFCHEWAFMDIYDKTEYFWKGMQEDYLPFFKRSVRGKKVALFPEAACVVGDKIYFTALRDSGIFCMNIQGKKPVVYCRMPEAQCHWRDFSAIYYYKEKLILLPHEETRIAIVDMQTKKTRFLALPWNGEVDISLGKYLKPVRRDEKIWFVTARQPMQIIEFDMETEIFDIYDQWPEEVHFDVMEYGFQFFSIYVYEDYLYLIKGDCNQNVRMNLETHKISVWEQENLRPYAIVNDKKIYSVPFYYNAEPSFHVTDRDTGKNIREESLETGICEGKFKYRWCNPIVTQDLIWYVPFKESCLLKIDKNTDELEKVMVMPWEYEVVKYLEHEYIGYDLVDTGERLILVPEGNNCLIYIDKQTFEITYQELYLPYEEYDEEALLKKMVTGDIIYENYRENLKYFILGLGWLGNESKNVSGQSNMIGREIIAKIVEDFM